MGFTFINQIYINFYKLRPFCVNTGVFYLQKQNNMSKGKYIFGSGKRHSLHDYGTLIIGYKIHQLTVTSDIFYENKRAKIQVKCDCGVVKNVRVSFYITGRIQSCGCLKKTNEKSKTHGMTKTKLYRRYRNMIGRCEDVNNKAYADYGGRGIAVNLSWREDYMNFYNWCKTSGFQPNLELNRIDNNGEYGPDNCNWVTKKEQGRNKRATKLIEGKTHGEILEQKYPEYDNKLMTKFKSRLTYGYTLEEALEDLTAVGQTPKRNRKFSKEQIIEIRIRGAEGESYTKIGKDFGVKYSIIWSIVHIKSYKDVA